MWIPSLNLHWPEIYSSTRYGFLSTRKKSPHLPTRKAVGAKGNGGRAALLLLPKEITGEKPYPLTPYHKRGYPCLSEKPPFCLAGGQHGEVDRKTPSVVAKPMGQQKELSNALDCHQFHTSSLAWRIQSGESMVFHPVCLDRRAVWRGGIKSGATAGPSDR